MTATFKTATPIYRQRSLSSYSDAARHLHMSKSAPFQYHSFKRHEHLSFVNHSLWRIHAGYVRTLTWNVEGEFVPLGFWSEGDVIGYPLAQTYPYEAQCLTAVKAESLSVTHPLTREMVLSQIQQSNSLLQIAHCRNAEQRILQFVCWLADCFGQVTASGIQILLKLTHQEIAESVGTTRVTVTRLLKSLESQGLIVWKPREKVVLRETFEQCYVRSNDRSRQHRE